MRIRAPADFGSVKISAEKLEISQFSANLDTSSAIPCEVSLISHAKPRRFTVKAMAKLGLGSFSPTGYALDAVLAAAECVFLETGYCEPSADAIEVRVASADPKT